MEKSKNKPLHISLAINYREEQDRSKLSQICPRFDI